MIVKEKHAGVETSGIGGSSAFRIRTSAKAFEVLSGGIYSDPILAIARELSCNAHDSMVESGNGSKQFVIKLPNMLDSTFYVEDFGLGLSDQDVETVYCTYFESTKTHTNDVDGCLGLGSKTPFSYTPDFTIRSRFNGVESTFVAYKNKGIPTISDKISEVETSEPNGLRVSIDVKSSDFNKFEEAVRKTLIPFKGHRPEVLGIANFEIKDAVPIYEVDNFAFHAFTRNSRWSSEPIVHVTQGNIRYKVAMHHLNMRAIHGAWNVWPIIDITMPIGSIDFAASREELNYTEETIAVLQESLNEAMVAFDTYITDQVVVSNVNDLFTLTVGDLWRYKEKAFNWNDCNFSASIQTDGISLKFKTPTGLKDSFRTGHNRHGYKRAKSRASSYDFHTAPEFTVSISKNHHWVFVDKAGMINKKLETLDKYVFIIPMSGTVEENQVRAKEIVTQFGLPDDCWSLLSDLRYERGVKSDKIEIRGHNYCINRSHRQRLDNPFSCSDFGSVQDISDAPSHKVYVPIYRKSPCDTDKNLIVDKFLHTIKLLKHYAIWGVPVHMVSKLDDSWISLYEMAAKEEATVKAFDDYDLAVMDCAAQDADIYDFIHELERDELTASTKWMDEIKAILVKPNDEEQFTRAKNWIRTSKNVDLTLDPALVKLTKTAFYVIYPLMEMFHSSWQRSQWKNQMQDYMEKETK